MKATDKQATAAVRAACAALPPGCEVILICAQPVEGVGIGGIYELNAFSNTFPPVASQIYALAEPLFGEGNSKVIAVPELDS